MAQTTGSRARLGHLITAVLLALALLPVTTPAAAQQPVDNNLTIPVIWADGAQTALPLRGDHLADADGDGVKDPVLAGSPVDIDGEADGPWFLQGDPANTWQAQTAEGPTELYAIEWGEELQVAHEVGTTVPIETALWARSDLLGLKTAEVPGSADPVLWGVNGLIVDYGGASVYSPDVTVTIRQVADALDAPVDEVLSGPKTYPAHVNNEGELVYAMQWNTTGLEPGVYELVVEVGSPAITFNDVWINHGVVDDNTSMTSHEIILTGPPAIGDDVVQEIVAAAPEVPAALVYAAEPSTDAGSDEAAAPQDPAPVIPPAAPDPGEPPVAPSVPDPTVEPPDDGGEVPDPDDGHDDCDGGSGGDHDDGDCGGGGSGGNGGDHDDGGCSGGGGDDHDGGCGGSGGSGGHQGAGADYDGDGIRNRIDNCIYHPNPDQADRDGDGLGDACDYQQYDPDGNYNPLPCGKDRDEAGGGGHSGGGGCSGGGDHSDGGTGGSGGGDHADGGTGGGGGGHEVVDTDLDGIADDVDNCVGVANPGQKDTNGDGVGDACLPGHVPGAGDESHATTADPVQALVVQAQEAPALVIAAQAPEPEVAQQAEPVAPEVPPTDAPAVAEAPDAVTGETETQAYTAQPDQQAEAPQVPADPLVPDPAPADSVAADPAPVEQVPVEPAPVEDVPAAPAPVEQAPVEPAPEPVAPAPSQPETTQRQYSAQPVEPQAEEEAAAETDAN